MYRIVSAKTLIEGAPSHEATIPVCSPERGVPLRPAAAPGPRAGGCPPAASPEMEKRGVTPPIVVERLCGIWMAIATALLEWAWLQQHSGTSATPSLCVGCGGVPTVFALCHILPFDIKYEISNSGCDVSSHSNRFFILV